MLTEAAAVLQRVLHMGVPLVDKTKFVARGKSFSKTRTGFEGMRAAGAGTLSVCSLPHTRRHR